MVEIKVSDEGMGISEQDQQQIFERYYRVKVARWDLLQDLESD